jgi:hypothetical protein
MVTCPWCVRPVRVKPGGAWTFHRLPATKPWAFQRHTAGLRRCPGSGRLASFWTRDPEAATHPRPRRGSQARRTGRRPPMRPGEIVGSRYRCTECGTVFRLHCACGDLSCAYNDCPGCEARAFDRRCRSEDGAGERCGSDLCPHERCPEHDGCQVCDGEGVWAGIVEVPAADVAAAMASEFEEDGADDAPALP